MEVSAGVIIQKYPAVAWAIAVVGVGLMVWSQRKRKMAPYLFIAIGVLMVITGTVLLYLREQAETSPVVPEANEQKASDQVARLIVLCKETDPTYTKLQRRPEAFFGYWLGSLLKMKAERANFDLLNLAQVTMRFRDGPDSKGLIDEAVYVLQCLDRNGYLKAEPTDKKARYWGVDFDNQVIRFSERWRELE